MTLVFAALAASYLVVLLIGVIGGLYLNRGMRRIPEHPVLRPHTSTPNPNRGSRRYGEPRLQVIEGGRPRVFDWARDA